MFDAIAKRRPSAAETPSPFGVGAPSTGGSQGRCFVDVRGRVLSINPRGAEILDVSPRSAVGRRLRELASDVWRPRGPREGEADPASYAVGNALASREPRGPASISIRTLTGRIVQLEYAAIPYDSDHCGGTGALVMFRQGRAAPQAACFVWRARGSDFILERCDGAARVSEAAVDALVGRSASTLLADQRDVHDALRRCAASGESERLTFPLKLGGFDGSGLFDLSYAALAPHSVVLLAEAHPALTHDDNAARARRARRLEREDAERQRLAAFAIGDARERERAVIAAELHDGLGQQIAALAFQLAHFSAELDEPRRARARELAQQAEEALDEVGRISAGLHPRVLEDLGLAPALNRLFATARPALDVDANLGGLDHPLPKAIQLAIYRLAQESLSNAIRHSGAKRAAFSVHSREVAPQQRELTVVFESEGPGRNARGTGAGLRNLHERLRSVGGVLNVVDRPDGGFTVRAWIRISRGSG